MKKSSLFFMIIVMICVITVLTGLTTGKRTCLKKSYICSSFNLTTTPDSADAVEPDAGFLPVRQSDVIYCKELLASIFHPPKYAS